MWRLYHRVDRAGLLVVLLSCLCGAECVAARSLVAWGDPVGYRVSDGKGIVSVDHSWPVPLKLMSDGSLRGDTTTPDGNDFVAISAGLLHNLALRSDGSIVGWKNRLSTSVVPVAWDDLEIPPDGNDFAAIAAGPDHNLALRKDGSIVGWGANDYGQASPPDGNDFVAIAAGAWHSLALRDDGSIAAWGANDWGQATPPSGNDFVAIDAGVGHSIALRSDGSIAAWGVNTLGQTVPPEGHDFVAIAAGGNHNLALKKDGSIVGWGDNFYGQATPPGGNDFAFIAAGGATSYALTRGPCEYVLAGDLNGDCRVNLDDLELLMENWLVDCILCPENPACGRE